MSERIQKVIRDMYGISRRDADDLVMQGKVIVNGEVAVPGQKVGPKDTISINELAEKNKSYQKQTQKSERVYFLVNKPPGYTSSTEDKFAERLVTELVPYKGHLMIAGRLDADSEGLVLLTNDGNLVNRLTHPTYNVNKIYDVEIYGHLTERELFRAKQGIEYNNEKYVFKNITITSYTPKTQKLKITLTEGKKREIREVMRFFGVRVITLKRTQIGPFLLGNIKQGGYKQLSQKEVAQLLAARRR
jgi:23S rRNA pseudouridine2605 synthase